MDFITFKNHPAGELKEKEKSLYSLVTSCLFHAMQDRMFVFNDCSRIAINIASNALCTSLANDSDVLLCVDNETPNVCYGFSLYNRHEKKLIFVYVKHKFRKLGIASKMTDYIESDIGIPRCSRLFKQKDHI